MAFLDKTGLQNLTNKLVQGDAIKVASSKGTTVKEVIDNIKRECESVALPNNIILENRVNQFVIGQSRDINVSRDVEEGLSQIQLQGQTYQNLCRSAANCSVQYSSNYDIENHNDKIIVTNKRAKDNADGWTYCYNDTLKVNMLKVSTKYTLFFKHESNFNTIPSVQFMRGSAIQHLSNAYTATKIKDNIFMCVITTLSSFQDKEIGSQILYFHNATPRKLGDKITLYKNMVLLEGDYSQIPIEEIPVYFEGIKSSFEDKVANINIQGKNLFDYREYSKDYQATVRPDINGFYYNCKSGAGYGGYIVSTLVEPNTTYSLSAERVGEATHTRLEIGIKDHEGHKKIFDTYYQSAQRTILTFKTPNQVGSDGKLYFKIWSTIYNGSSYTINNFIGVANIQLEKGKPTSFEPYCNENYKFDIKEPLRRLPNGVCDEIRNNNGKWELVRRINKIIIDHTVDFNKEAQHNNTIRFYSSGNFTTKYKIKTSSHGLCDKVPFLHGDSNDVFHCRFDGSFPYATLKIWIDKNKLNSEDEQGLKAWLQANPIIVYGELAEPIITPIDPIEFNVSQGTTININSDITPISTHEVILNRSGQVEQGIELIANLRSRIDKLEKTYDSNLIATQYRLNNLKLNYELEREED